jgi:hypothetical protein
MVAFGGLEVDALEVNAYSGHQLTGWDELITRCPDAKYVGKACVDAVFVSEVFTNKLDAPVGVGRREAQDHVDGVVAVDFIGRRIVEDTMPKVAAMGVT